MTSMHRTDCVFETRHRKKKLPSRRGLTLLEVMLALAIAGLSLAAISELVSIGVRAAEQSRDISTAQFLAEGKLNEFAAGVGVEGAVAQQRFLDNPDWVYSVGIQPLNDSGLVAVTVVVERAEAADVVNPFRFRVIRWMPDQLLQLNQPTDDPYTDATASSGANGGTATGSTGETGGTSGTGGSSGVDSASIDAVNSALQGGTTSGLGGSLPSRSALPADIGGALPTGASAPSGFSLP